ncbi:hypothetical protein HL653_17830 [Sphingomonas sp. AP4-R1]|uniref:hypothetical protein n=1 Tax=Sphingomonas sp. AP4-R1 TaxID=2735134 RepID=UPI0014936111|nr:hypothetical protein [Sphingomonas sp. AP4-R1]QJU59368.1 hypothetical protein HL653_17830 [Sphingomonas sp. AP4-R1]
MSIRIELGLVHLEGACPVGDAEPLLAALQSVPEVVVDLSTTTRLHLAVVQLLLVARPAVRGVPADPFLRDHILPKLRQLSAQDTMPGGGASV